VSTRDTILHSPQVVTVQVVGDSRYAQADVYFPAVMITFFSAIGMGYLLDVAMIPIGAEGTHQQEKGPSHHHVVQETSLPHGPSHRSSLIF
jgi:hypothetical protein